MNSALKQIERKTGHHNCENQVKESIFVRLKQKYTYEIRGQEQPYAILFCGFGEGHQCRWKHLKRKCFMLNFDMCKHLHAFIVMCITTRACEAVYYLQNVFILLFLHQLWAVVKPMLWHHDYSASTWDFKKSSCWSWTQRLN